MTSLFHTLPSFLLVLFCHRSFLEGTKICQFTGFSYMCSICIYSVSIFLFLYYCSLFVFYPVISEIPRYRSAINKNNTLMLSFLSDLILLCVYLSQKGQVEMLSRMQYYCSVQQYRLHTAIVAWTEFEWCKEATRPVSLAPLQRSPRNAKGKLAKAKRCTKSAFLKRMFPSLKLFYAVKVYAGLSKWNKVLFESSSD